MRIITAREGKIFRRISDGTLFGNEVYLGLAYPKDAEPYEELPEHFEEIERKTVTLADYRELERKVELLMQMTGGMI